MDPKETFSSWKVYLILFGVLILFCAVYYQIVRATDKPAPASADSQAAKQR